MSVKVVDVAAGLGVSRQRVNQYLQDGRISGAYIDPKFSRWIVPEGWKLLPPTRHKRIDGLRTWLRKRRTAEQQRRVISLWLKKAKGVAMEPDQIALTPNVYMAARRYFEDEGMTRKEFERVK